MSEIFATACILALFALAFLAWCTHIVFCFVNGAWALLLAGAIFFPIGIGHGIWLWL